MLEGHEADYIDWFLKAGTKDRREIDGAVRQSFVEAYSSRAALRCGFAHYRAFQTDAQQIDAMVLGPKATLPILAIAGGVVGEALARQLGPVSTNLKTETIPDCAHLIPLEQPGLLLAALREFMA